MSARKRPKAAPLRMASDFGPVLARVVVMDAADPEVPSRTVRRAKVRVHWQCMDLTQRQFDTADRMQGLLEQASGACWQPDGPRVRRPAHQQGHPTERQIDAQGSLSAARAACGQAGYYLLEMVVGGNIPVTKVAATSGETPRRVRDRLTEALAIAASVWRIAS